MSLALLSPSLDYRGLRIEAPMKKIGGRPVLLVASDEDSTPPERPASCRKPAAASARPLMLSQAGHGTTMLGRNPELAASLVDWFRRTLVMIEVSCQRNQSFWASPGCFSACSSDGSSAASRARAVRRALRPRPA